jgi:hypothetical protein
MLKPYEQTFLPYKYLALPCARLCISWLYAPLLIQLSSFLTPPSLSHRWGPGCDVFDVSHGRHSKTTGATALKIGGVRSLIRNEVDGLTGDCDESWWSQIEPDQRAELFLRTKPWLIIWSLS